MANKTLLEPDKYYHIFNHSIGEEKLFKEDSDFSGFICRYIKHVVPVSDTLAYCLMPNHFHFCIKLKGTKELILQDPKFRIEKIESRIYRSVSHFLNGYVQAYNSRYLRMGGLFVGNFKRKPINSDDDLRRLVCYIHNNPVKAKFVSSPEQWHYSSYSDIVSLNPAPKIPTFLSENLRIFNDIENFKFLHKQTDTLEGFPDLT